MDARATGIANWLAGEMAAVEAALTAQGAGCSLDRRRASPLELKYLEGRYAVLRRARRLVERGESLLALHADAEQARAFVAGGALGADRQWLAYQQGVLDAVQAVLACTACDAAGHEPGPDTPAASGRG